MHCSLLSARLVRAVRCERTRIQSQTLATGVRCQPHGVLGQSFQSSHSLHFLLHRGADCIVLVARAQVSTVIFDYLNYLFVISCVMAVFGMYGNHAFVGTSSHAGATFLLLFLYGLAVIPLSYCYSFVFDNAPSAQVGIAGLHFVFGFVLVIASFILDNGGYCVAMKSP
jgi:hypothetical protein